MKRPAVFLDRDGTLIREREYLSDPEQVEILPGTAAGLRRLQGAGYWLIVTSNQSGVARGYFSEQAVRAVHDRLQSLLTAEQVPLDAIYYCPHFQQGAVSAYARQCDCRKPKPGMLLAAAAERDIDWENSWVVGDKMLDLEFGRSNGLRTVLVLTGYGNKTSASGFPPGLEPDAVAADLSAAADAILAAGPRKAQP